MRPAIIVFAKAPIPGAVKTRLLGRFSPEDASDLHAACVRDLLDTLTGLAGSADVELHTDKLSDAWNSLEVAKRLQAQGDLGARMLHSINEGLRAGRPSVLIAGGDAPTVPAGNLQRLLASEADVALGPTEDGGYYAIQCRRTDPRMFAGVRWSTERALEQTVRAVERCGLSVETGPCWHDIDTPQDVLRLAAAERLPRNLERWMRERGLRPSQ